LLTVLGFICGINIESIYASDILIDAIELAKENLNLLTKQGLNCRKTRLEKMYNEYGKQSHSDAIISTDKLLKQINLTNNTVDYSVFSADILNENSLVKAEFKADIIFTDVPYGNLVSWSENNQFAIDILLNTLIPILSDNSIIAISSVKSQKIINPQFKRIRKILIGKRKIELLQKVK
jgi:hypothetical protein